MGTNIRTLISKDIFGKVIVEAARKNENIVVCDADLMRCFGTKDFSVQFPDRHFNFGIAEQNCIAASAGLALSGKNVFAASFANFASKRACDQVSIAVAYNEANVKVCGLYAGLTAEKNGGTHIGVEDMAIMRAIPNMVVVEAGDTYELEAIAKFMMDYEGPVYFRQPKMYKRNVFDENITFELGKGVEVAKGTDAVVIASGIMLGIAYDAVQNLKQNGIDVGLINMPSLKPFDSALVLKAALETDLIITCENHSIIGGLGSAVFEVIAENGITDVKIVRLGINDQFGITADLDSQLEKFGLTAKNIEETVQKCKKGARRNESITG